MGLQIHFAVVAIRPDGQHQVIADGYPNNQLADEMRRDWIKAFRENGCSLYVAEFRAREETGRTDCGVAASIIQQIGEGER